ncbi:MAG: hypothetical protein KatS3mg111_0926 [Pirellulaceae bacterium]|nr:MAG: hypothetical protein KatS3mg111_0926 [Pirellulaceae bacterium]
MNLNFCWRWIGVIAVTIVMGCQPTDQEEFRAEVSQEPTQAKSSSAPLQTAQKAVAGVGMGGQRLADHTEAQKIISGPVAQLRNFQQRAVFEIQIPQALQLFQATEGRLPRSHGEFMEKIVRANRLQLPELPPGIVYRFNVEKGELWVYPEEEAPAE